MDDEPHVLTRREGAVGVMTFNRPKSLNTLDLPMVDAMEAALDLLERDPEVRAIVVTGCDDRTFIAGGNIRDLGSRRGLAHYGEFATRLHHVFRRFETCPKPIVAAVNGWALGGGLELILCTDLRIASDKARLGVPEINLGLFPGAGGSQRLIREISPCQARMMMFLGDPIDAPRALQLGLVNEVVPAAELMPRTLALAAQLAARSPLTLKLLKRALRDGTQMPLPLALAHEQAMIGLVLDSRDAHEGCQAFIDKRRASFEGR